MLVRTLGRHIDHLFKAYGKMVFLSGPRQVGKTTLAKAYAAERGGAQYFNWDVLSDQRRMANAPYFFSESEPDVSAAGRPGLVVFDELHKYARWKAYLKGAYDAFVPQYQFLVTGSGRLDLFKRGGDSLVGRYLSVPLFPLSVGELTGRLPTWDQFVAGLEAVPVARRTDSDAYRTLALVGGFPEPFLRQERSFYELWSAERRVALVREDVRDATRIRDLSLLEMLTHLLPERVGSPLSINALREDLGLAFETVRDWLGVLGQFYYLFTLLPYSGRLTRALRKEAKVYLHDWAELDDPARRFENLVAAHLLKAVRTWNAMGAGGLDLWYVRDKEKHEVDFLITRKNRPQLLVEAKLADEEPSPHLRYFQERLRVPIAVQLLGRPGVLRRLGTRSGEPPLWVASADRWLAMLP